MLCFGKQNPHTQKEPKLPSSEMQVGRYLFQPHYTRCGVSSVTPSPQQLTARKCKLKLIFLKHLDENCSHLGTSVTAQLYLHSKAEHADDGVIWTIHSSMYIIWNSHGAASPAGRKCHLHFSSIIMLLCLLFLCFLSRLQDSSLRPRQVPNESSCSSSEEDTTMVD